jgi:cysteine desulfurase
MKKIYLDNASTTAIRPEVVQEITRLMTEDYGNPSSTHSFGRNAKNILELSRKSIAKQLNVVGSEIFFTSSGTEANNWILRSAVKDLHVKRIITTTVEHHAVLYPVFNLQKEFGIQIDFVKIKQDGSIDVTHLAELLSQEVKTLVSLMHVNNEVGTILDLERISTICKQHNALFHSDTVQSVGKTEIDLKELPIDFISASAHKFHGPKGIGFVFIRKNSGVQPFLLGGEQERGMRGGTESIYLIAGMAKALEIAYANLEAERVRAIAFRICEFGTSVYDSIPVAAGYEVVAPLFAGAADGV